MLHATNAARRARSFSAPAAPAPSSRPGVALPCRSKLALTFRSLSAPLAHLFLHRHSDLAPAETPLFLAFPARHPSLTPGTKRLPGCPSGAGNLPNWHSTAMARSPELGCRL